MTHVVPCILNTLMLFVVNHLEFCHHSSLYKHSANYGGLTPQLRLHPPKEVKITDGGLKHLPFLSVIMNITIYSIFHIHARTKLVVGYNFGHP